MTNFREHKIVSGQTIQMIAQRLLGDAGRGLELAILNDLEYPFIAPIGSERRKGVKIPGDTILIPVEVEYNVTVEEIDSDLYSRALGVDLSLSSDKVNLSFGSSGDLDTSFDGDLRTYSGVDTLKQDLVHRLVTELGTLPYHPEYGSKFLSIVGNRKDYTWKQKASIEVSKTFKSDSRVVDVTDVSVEYLTTGLHVRCSVVTAINRFIMEEMLNI